MELQHAVSNLVVVQKEEFVRNLKAMALASKAGFGSKEADREINKIARSAETEKKELIRDEMQKGPVPVADTAGLKVDLKKLSEVKLSNVRNNRPNNPRAS